MSAPNKPPPHEDPLRPHSFDGIHEYDKRMPNWWLFTLYGAIVFSVVYWLYYHLAGVGMTDKQILARDLEAVAEARLASSMGTLGDGELWSMSRDPKFVNAGRVIFETNCAACHLSSLRGKEENPATIGPSLADSEWIHGGRSSEVRQTITNGVLDKGMLAWGPVLGDRKIVEVTAYVLSHHAEPGGGVSN